MNISVKSCFPIVAAGLLTLSACESSSERAERYMSGHTYNEYKELTNTTNNVLIQSRLDSLAYRNIFNGTKAAKDSALVAEFNQIANNMRGYPEKSDWSMRYGGINGALASKNITTGEMNDIQNKSKKLLHFSLTLFQYHADTWAYKKFFEKAGIMNDDIAKKCDEAAKHIRP